MIWKIGLPYALVTGILLAAVGILADRKGGCRGIRGYAEGQARP